MITRITTIGFLWTLTIFFSFSSALAEKGYGPTVKTAETYAKVAKEHLIEEANGHYKFRRMKVEFAESCRNKKKGTGLYAACERPAPAMGPTAHVIKTISALSALSERDISRLVEKISNADTIVLYNQTPPAEIGEKELPIPVNGSRTDDEKILNALVEVLIQ